MFYGVFSIAHLKLDRNPVDHHPFGHELYPHCALEVLRELVVVEPRDEVALAHVVVAQQDHLFLFFKEGSRKGGRGNGKMCLLFYIYLKCVV